MKDYKKLQNGSDIRGVALQIDGGKPVNLTKEAAADIAYGFAVWLSEKLGKNFPELTIAVGGDSRLTTHELGYTMAITLQNMGVNVLVSELSTTPAMFMATVFDSVKADGSVMITASHLPVERNGMKFFTREGGLDKPDIAKIIQNAENRPPYSTLSIGSMEKTRLMDAYAKHLRTIICEGLGAKEEDKPLSGLHIVVDAGNGAGGFYVSSVLEPLGADCSGSQFLEPDGNFPNHIPNPENEEAMNSICAAVKASKADLGIIFDTDVDRSSAVDENGCEIARNRIVALAAVIAAEGQGNATIVTDSITSTQLADFLKAKGLVHFRFKRGYKNVINKMIEMNKDGGNCPLAIETSGHAAMRENYDLDDGAYLATKIVVKAAQLKKAGKGISALLDGLEDPKESIEIRLNVNTDDFGSYAQQVLDEVKNQVEAGNVEGASLELPNYEGVRVNMADGWFLIRKSLHDPVIPINIESNAEGGCERIHAALNAIISKFDKLS